MKIEKMTVGRMMRCTGLMLALAAGTGVSHGQCGATKMTSAAPAANDRIGSAMSYGVSASGQRLVVGAPDAEVAPFFGAGKVKFMGRVGNQWGELATLTKPSGIFTSDRFGAAVGYDGNNRIIAGAPGHQTNRGAAYIYEFLGSWTAVATLTGGAQLDRMGEGVAIDGDWAFIGSPGADTTNNPDSGVVSIQRRNANGTWSQTQTVSNTDFNGFYSNRNLGEAIAAEGGVAVIGAPGTTLVTWPNFHGAIKVLRLNGATWQVEADDLAPHPRRIGANFGAAVATDGVRIAVGAPGYGYTTQLDGVSASEGGSVWVMKFEGGQWVQEGHIQSPAPTGLGRFGSSVAIEGGRLMVGEPGTKRAYAYRLVANAWVLDRVYQDEDAAGAGAFGASVAVSDQNVFIGDTHDDTASVNDAGAVYIKPLPAGWSDSCEGAMAISAGTTTGCTREASPDNVPVCGLAPGTATGKGVWMSWTPNCSGNVIIDTIGSDFDTVLSVHSGCPSQENPSVIACNDDSSFGTVSLLTFNYTAGARYLINVRGFSSHEGTFTLRINEWQTPGNDQCSSPASVTIKNTYAFANCKATTDAGMLTSCVSAATTNDVWFRFTAPGAAGTLGLNTNGSNFDTVLSVYATGSCPTGMTSAACDDDGGLGWNSSLAMAVQPGQQYMVRVAGFSTTVPSGDGVLNVDFTPMCLCDWNLSGQLSVQDIFDFLASYFAGSGDINASGATTVQDIFDFLACYFAGCN